MTDIVEREWRGDMEAKLALAGEGAAWERIRRRGPRAMRRVETITVPAEHYLRWATRESGIELEVGRGSDRVITESRVIQAWARLPDEDGYEGADTGLELRERIGIGRPNEGVRNRLRYDLTISLLAVRLLEEGRIDYRPRRYINPTPKEAICEVQIIVSAIVSYPEEKVEEIQR